MELIASIKGVKAAISLSVNNIILETDEQQVVWAIKAPTRRRGKHAEADSSSSKSKEAEEANEREEEDGGADRSDAVAQGGRRLRGRRFGARHLRRAHVPPQEPRVQRGLAHRVPVPSRPHRGAARGAHHQEPQRFRRAPHCWDRALLWNVLHRGLS